MKTAIIVYLLSTSAVLAHGGHAAAVTQGEAHWLTAPDHLTVLVLAGLALCLLVPVVLHVIRARRARA